MAKIIDITEKLNFKEKPQIKIKDTVLTVNNEAVAILEVIPKLNEKMTLETIESICNVIFELSEIEKIKELKLDIDDFIVVIESAIQVISSDNNNMGETVTRTMT